MKLRKCNIVEELEIVVQPKIMLEYSKDSIADLGNLINLELIKKLDKEDLNLETDDKTIVGAINEINTSNLTLKLDISQESKDRILDIQTIQNTKQDKYDEGLKTADKTVVGGINEVYDFILGGEGGGGIYPPQPSPSIAVDEELNKDSSNAIANKAVAEKFEEIEGLIGTGGGSADVTMGETFTTNMVVGGIDSGTQIKATDTIKTIIKNMLLKLKEAFVKSNPSASISPTGGNVEYGTTVSSAFTANLIDGKFTQYTNGGTSTQDINMGCSKTSAAFQKKAGSDSYTDYTNGTSFKVDETTYIKAIVSHSASTAEPTNSDGSSTLSYAAGSKEATATYTPRLGWFFVTLDAMPESVTRETFGNYKGLITGAFNTTQSFDKKVVLLAIPNAYKLSSALSANNEEQTYDESSITIADAGGTDRSYKLFAFKYDAVLGVNVTFKITT